MRVTPLRLLPPFSKTASRRTRLLLGIVLLCLVPSAALGAAGTANIALEHSRENLIVHLRAENLDIAAVRTTLRDGGNARINFSIRVYRLRSGIAALLGDTLLYEHTRTFVATSDLFSSDYLIRTSGGNGEQRFSSFRDFIAAFTSTRHRIAREQLPGGGKLVIKCRVELISRELVPPFTLLRPIVPGIEQSTPWQSARIPSPAGAEP